MARTYISKWKHGNKSKYKLRTFSAMAPRGYDPEKARYSKKYKGIIFPKKEEEKK
jgi:hypothetical protein